MTQVWHQHAATAARSGAVSVTPSTSTGWTFAWAVGPNPTTGSDDTWLGDVPDQAYPVCGNGRIYQPRGSDGIRAWTLSSGSAAWHNTDATFNGPPAYDHHTDSLIAGASSGDLYRINAATGATVATWDGSSAINKAVALRDGFAYIVCADGSAKKIRIRDMTQVWSYSGGSSSGQAAQSHPAVGIADGIVKMVYATADGYVHAVDDTAGTASWRVKPYTQTWTADHNFDGAWPVIAPSHGVVLIRAGLPQVNGGGALSAGPETGRFPGDGAATSGDTIRTWFGTRSSPGSGAAYANLFAIDMTDGSEAFVPAVGHGSVEDGDGVGGDPFGVMGSQPVLKTYTNGDEVVYMPFRNKDISDALSSDYRWDTTYGEMVLDSATVSGLEAGDLRFVTSNKSYSGITNTAAQISDEQCMYSMAGGDTPYFFHAHWSAVEPYQITDRSDSLGLTHASPIAATKGQFATRGAGSGATTNFSTRIRSSSTNEADGRFFDQPAWFVYKGVQEPPGNNNVDPSTYSAGMRPRYTFVHNEYVVHSGNGGSLFILTHSGTVAAAPTIDSVSDNRADYASSQVPVASMLEVHPVITTTATKLKWPYDPEAPSGIDGTLGINVEVHFSDDDFVTWVTKPAYYEQTFTHLVNADSPSTISAGQDWLYPTTTYQWTAKFAPTSAGTWKYKVSAEDAAGTGVSSASTGITVISSAAKGIIQRAAADTRYFEYANGDPFWPVGGNWGETGDNQSNFTDVDMDDGESGNATSFAAHASTGGINFMRWFMRSIGIQSNGGSPWTDANNRTRLSALARDGVTADSGSGSDFGWRLDNRSYAITTTGTLTIGTFTITIDGQTTSAIPYTAAGDTVYSALIALSNVGDTNMLVDLAGGPTMATAGTVVRFYPTPDCPLPTSVSISSSVGGGSIALTSTAAGIGSTFIRDGWQKRSPAVKPSTVYKFTVRYNIPTTLVAADGNASGLTVKIDTNWVSDPPAYGISGTGKYITDATSGSGGSAVKALTATGGWATLTGYWAAGSTTRWLPYIYVVLENLSTSSGGQTCYIDYVKIEETNGSGTVNGPQVNNRWDADFHQEWDEYYSKNLDLILTEADANDIVMKLVVGGADALVASFTDANGVDVSLLSNYYGPTDQTITRGRWWLRAWWRYVQARWGHFASVHTFEVLNEGDPLNARHAALARMFGDYMGQKAARWANPHLTTTSHYNSYPRKFWVDAGLQLTTAGIDYSDVHLYVRKPDQYSGTQTYRSDLLSYSGADATNIDIYQDDPGADWNDLPLNVDRMGDQIGANGSQGLGAPIMRGETGLYTSSTDDPSTEVASDTGMIWLHKHLWSQLHSSGFMDPSWWYWRTNIYDRSDGAPNQLAKFKPFSDFVSDIPLNNGHYVDINATAPHADLRVWGQKDNTNNRVHGWIDHSVNTWQQVVNGTPTVTARSGSVTIPVSANGTWDVEWYDPYTSGSTPSSTTTATASGGVLTLPALVSLGTDIAFKAEFNSGSSVTGTVAIVLPAASFSATGTGGSHMVSITSAARNAACDGVVDLVDAGTPPGLIKVYSGSVPADVNASLGAAVLLATLTYSTTAFGASSSGVATAATITSDSSADATGTASFFRVTNAAGTAILQGTVGTSGADMNLNTTSIVSGAVVAITAMTVTMPAS